MGILEAGEPAATASLWRLTPEAGQLEPCTGHISLMWAGDVHMHILSYAAFQRTGRMEGHPIPHVTDC